MNAQEPSAADVVVSWPWPPPSTRAVTLIPGSATPSESLTVPDSVPLREVRSWTTSSDDVPQLYPNNSPASKDE